MEKNNNDKKIANQKKKIAKSKKPKPLLVNNLPPELRGLPSNKYRGQQLLHMKALKGCEPQKAEKGCIVVGIERQRIEQRLLQDGLIDRLSYMPTIESPPIQPKAKSECEFTDCSAFEIEPEIK